MSRRFVKVCFGAGLVVASVLGAASAAQAAVWHTNGSVNFTATAPPSRFIINSPTPVAINCSTTGMTGTLNPTQASGIGIMDLTPTFAACTIAGITYSASCVKAKLNARTYSGSTMGRWLGGITHGTVDGLRCTFTRLSCTLVIEGLISDFSVTNATDVAPDALRIEATGQNLHATASAGCTGVLSQISSSSTQFGTQSSPPGPLTHTVTTPSALASQPRAAFF